MNFMNVIFAAQKQVTLRVDTGGSPYLLTQFLSLSFHKPQFCFGVSEYFDRRLHFGLWLGAFTAGILSFNGPHAWSPAWLISPNSDLTFFVKTLSHCLLHLHPCTRSSHYCMPSPIHLLVLSPTMTLLRLGASWGRHLPSFSVNSPAPRYT